MKIRSAVLIVTALLSLLSGCDRLGLKVWKFKDVSTKSGPRDLPIYRGAPCPECRVIGPTLIISGEEYSAGKAIIRPDGSRVDITWWAPRDPNRSLSIEELERFPWKFREATFIIPDLRDYQEWQNVVDDLQKLNGAYSGRAATDNHGEIVYWGEVSVRESSSVPRINCSTNCLAIFGWLSEGKWHMNAHLSSKMRSEQTMTLIP